MAVIQMKFASWTLTPGMPQPIDLAVILPDYDGDPAFASPADYYRNGPKYKTLWLLHGGGGDCMDWILKTNIVRYAAERRLAVVMPSARSSSYTNPKGFEMYNFMNQELLPLARAWFNLSERREDNFVAGLSMGGLGAWKWAINRPELFAGAVILSCGPFDVLEKVADPEDRFGFRQIYGGGPEKVRGSADDMYLLAEQLVQAGSEIPRLYVACGSEDPVAYQNFLDFKVFANRIGLPVQYAEESGRHEWKVWDSQIQKGLDYLGLARTVR